MNFLDVIGPTIDGGGEDILLIIGGIIFLIILGVLIYYLLKKERETKVMKKISLFLLGVLVLGMTYVKADAGGPSVISYDVVVTNKDGATCYTHNGSKYTKTSKKLAYGTVINIYDEFNDGYVPIWKDSCDYIKSSDVKTKKDSLSPTDESVEEIVPLKAVILAKGGLNLRKGPAVAYGRVTTIPQYTVVTLTHRGGDYWYYVKYNGKSGWISGINNYFGYDRNEILISSKDTNIYDLKDQNKKLGTIPAFTEITDYIVLSSDGYYVNYNGIKGYAYLTSNIENGKVKVLVDSNIYSGQKVIGTVKKGEILDYSFQDYDDDGKAIFNIPSLNGILRLKYNNYEVVQAGVATAKTKGFIGEGLFGEKKTVATEPEPTENPQDNPEEKPQTDKEPWSKELIIICVLGSIILALIVIIIILLINKKKNKKVVVENPKMPLETPKEEMKKTVEVSEEKKEE